MDFASNFWNSYIPGNFSWGTSSLSSITSKAKTNFPSKVRKLRSITKTFAQWNLVLVHLQHSKTLEKQENKEKLFEINV